jgi:long-subunit acyl-CoA synthetase (AMP-forming)
MNLGLHEGATIVTMPRFDLEQCLQVMQNHRVTFAPVVPPVMLALAKHPIVDQFDLSHVTTLLSGAAPLREELGAAVAARLRCRIIQGYGMTETASLTSLSHPFRTRRGSIGKPVSGQRSAHWFLAES